MKTKEMRILLKLLFFFLAIFPMANAKDMNSQPTYYTIRYIIKPADNLAEIYRTFIKDNSIVNKKTPMVKKTLAKNDNIKNWHSLPAGERIVLYISPEYLDRSKFKIYESKIIKEIQKVSKSIETKPAGKAEMSPYQGSVFYMGSYGSFNQESSEFGSISFQQNSPLTLGGNIVYDPVDSKFSYSGSAYGSYLVPASNNVNTDEVSITPEIGGNGYVEYYYRNIDARIYSGLDAERFTTFDLASIEQDSKIDTIDNNVLYLTVGLSKKIRLLDSDFFNKLSFSKSFYSSASTSSSGRDEAYDGFKVLWYVNKKITKRFFAHSLFKFHTMSGGYELTSTRIGLGVGYLF